MLKFYGLKVAKSLFLFSLISFVSLQSINTQNIKLKIEGIDLNQTTIIDSLGYNGSFTDLKSLQMEIADIQKKLQLKGYIENLLISNTKQSDSTYLAKIDLKTRFYTIYIYYHKEAISTSFLRSFLTEVTDTYIKVPIDDVGQVLSTINNWLASKGLPFNSVKLANLEKKGSNSIEANLVVRSNNIRNIDNINIKGYEKFPRSFLKYYAKINKGDVLDLDDLKKKALLINNLPFSNQTRDPEILFSRDSSVVYLYLEKSKSNSFDGFLGFGTNEANNKLEFYGYLDLSLRNNLNYGETLNIKYRSDGNDQRTFNANIVLPYLLSSAIGSELSINIFKQDSTFTTTQQTADLFYQINDKQKISLGITSTKSNNLLNADSSNDVNDFNTNFYTLGYQYNIRQPNDFLFPFSFGFDGTVGFGNRKLESTEQQQSIFRIQAFKIFNLNAKNSIYLNLTTAGINSDDYLNNELLRFGGLKSIRGFEENSIFASLYGLINSEYRYRLNPSIYVHTIIDAAYLKNDLIDLEEKLFGFGFGFGLMTRSGLLKFNYANGTSENQKFKLSNSKVHLGLTLIM